jgi:pSer/pThr/pTyr-binding forkhead associated (FHA) protein
VIASRFEVEILAGTNVGQTFDFADETVVVGRAAHCALQLNSPHVSRQQCELSWQGDQLVLENLGTVNVTYLNDRPIERVYVQDGD